MEPTMLQQLYLSKHNVRISANYTLYDGYITQIGDMSTGYYAHIPCITDMVYEHLIYDPEPDIPISITWNNVEEFNELIDYYYVIHQCITDPSTIGFGFDFSSYIPQYGPGNNYHAYFKVAPNGIITGSCGEDHYNQYIIYNNIEDMIRDSRDENNLCECFEKFWWKRKISGIPGFLGG